MPRVVRRKAVQSRDFGRGGVRELWDLLTYIIKIKKTLCCAKKYIS